MIKKIFIVLLLLLFSCETEVNLIRSYLKNMNLEFIDKDNYLYVFIPFNSCEYCKNRTINYFNDVQCEKITFIFLGNTKKDLSHSINRLNENVNYIIDLKENELKINIDITFFLKEKNNYNRYTYVNEKDFLYISNFIDSNFLKYCD